MCRSRPRFSAVTALYHVALTLGESIQEAADVALEGAVHEQLLSVGLGLVGKEVPEGAVFLRADRLVVGNDALAGGEDVHDLFGALTHVLGELFD